MVSLTSPNDYSGYVVYGKSLHQDNVPIGIVSHNGDRRALCNQSNLSPRFVELLLHIEDRRYFKHHGIDFKAIVRATIINLSRMRILQGGSTITQQLARCLLNDYRRCFSRKVKEAFLALILERAMSKSEIMHLYINNVFLGENIYGLRAASIGYFGKEPSHLSMSEQVSLITLLRAPNLYLGNRGRFLKRYKAVSHSLISNNVVHNRKRSLMVCRANIEQHLLHRFSPICASTISSSTDSTRYILKTAILKELQDYVAQYASSCKYATSVVCISKGEVIASASSNGSHYPFSYRGNVGSTLKPFIYCFLRENGVARNDRFSTMPRKIGGWSIREVKDPSADFMTLEVALQASNNNVFVNACYSFGIDKVLSYLSQVLSIKRSELVPATILGACTQGISLFELSKAYFGSVLSKIDWDVVLNH
jgi:membrane peptidoglycan carboxypeptidase